MEARGGWVNPSSVELFRCYATFLAEELGDLVDFWGPINEPTAYAGLSYLWGRFPPCQTDPAKYQTVLRHLLLAHGEAYRAIHDVLGKNRTRSAPKVGTVKDMTYFQPYDEQSPDDRKEAASRHQSYNAAFMDSINTGRISPPMGNGERVPVLKDAWDFIGYNYYFRHLVQGATPERSHRDMLTRSKDSLGLTDTGWEIYPQGIYEITKWLKGYGKPLYITENGTAVHDDNVRSMFIVLHLEQVHKAIQEGADVKGYLYWSLIDNFEWDSGFIRRFGIVEVDYKTLKRTPRPSAYLYRDIIKNNGITADMLKKYREIAEHRKGKT
jgi:beta-glucosidase